MEQSRPPTPERAAQREAARPGRLRDRPRAHEGTSVAETAIFEATEKLLAQQSLQDLSVAQIIGEAGVSRATFYFYFGSKFSVVASLLARITDEIFEFVQPFVNRSPTVEPQEALGHSLRSAIEIWERHRPTLRATIQHWSTDDEIGRQWVAGVELFTEAIAAQIDRDRQAGLASGGPDARQLAAALLWGTQHCLFAAGLGVDSDIDGERGALEPLMAIWSRAIYG